MDNEKYVEGAAYHEAGHLFNGTPTIIECKKSGAAGD
jgi:hypothetical protein